ncbi:MAG: serine/threonine-protein kinase [Myxococcota bacterium]
MGTLEPGTQLGNYTVEDVLGYGGSATVYRARQLNLERTVALKVLDAHEGAPESTLSNFKHEAAVAAHLNHPNVVTIYEHGAFTGHRDHDLPFIAMELLEGRSLQQELEQHGPLEPNRALKLFVPCMDALGKAHSEGIIHKDLKPSNLFITYPGDPLKEGLVILDYGIARFRGRSVTLHGQVQGTPQYMAPEYLRQSAIGPPMDIYQMGLILSEALTGITAVQFADPFPAMMAHCDGNLTIPTELLESPFGPVIKRCICQDPQLRYAEGYALRDALQQLQHHHGILKPIHVAQDTAALIPSKTLAKQVVLDAWDAIALDPNPPQHNATPPPPGSPDTPKPHGTPPSAPYPLASAPRDTPSDLALTSLAPPLHSEQQQQRPVTRALLLIAMLTLLAGTAFYLGTNADTHTPATVPSTQDTSTTAATVEELQRRLHQAHQQQRGAAPSYMKELDTLVEQEQWGAVVGLLDRAIATEEFTEGLRLLRNKALLEQEMKSCYQASLKAIDEGDFAQALVSLDRIEANAKATLYARYVREQKLRETVLAELAKMEEKDDDTTDTTTAPTQRRHRNKAWKARLARSTATDPQPPTDTTMEWADDPPLQEGTPAQERYQQLIDDAIRANAQGNHPEAIAKAREALTYQRSIPPHRILALAFDRMGNVERAIHHYNQVLVRTCRSRLGAVARTRIYQLGGKPVPCMKDALNSER